MINIVAGGRFGSFDFAFCVGLCEGAKANVPNECWQSRDVSGCNKLSTKKFFFDQDISRSF
jgi:hypothetical protein